MSSTRRFFNYVLFLALLLDVAGCSYLTGDDGIFRDRKKDYKYEKTTSRMEIPDDLDKQAIVDHYVIPDVGPYADPDMIDEIPLPVGVAKNDGGAVKILSSNSSSTDNSSTDNPGTDNPGTDNSSEWIFIRLASGQVWPRLKEFLQHENLVIRSENSKEGIMIAKSADATYHFKIEEGLQRNTAEVSVRYIDDASEVSTNWPAQSSHHEAEHAMIQKLAQFYADISDKSAYSFAAQAIGTQKRLYLNQDGKGNKTLVLQTTPSRASVSLKQGLDKAEFAIIKTDESNKSYKVRYMPKPLIVKKPGFFSRLFHLTPDAYDEDIEYAGNYYTFALSPLENSNSQQISINVLDTEDKTDNEIRKEKNAMLLLLKGRIY